MINETKEVEKIKQIFPGVSLMMQQAIKHTLKLAHTPIRSAVLVRALNNITQTIEVLDIEALEKIASASSNLDVLLSLFEESVALESKIPVKENPLRKIRLKGIQAKSALLKKEGGVITSAQVSQLLRISRQAIDKRRKQGNLLAVSLGRRGYFYPVWQFSDDGILPGFETIMNILKDYDPWMKMIFMLTTNRNLNNRTPLEKLREGDLENVVRAAQLATDQGA